MAVPVATTVAVTEMAAVTAARATLASAIPGSGTSGSAILAVPDATAVTAIGASAAGTSAALAAILAPTRAALAVPMVEAGCHGGTPTSASAEVDAALIIKPLNSRRPARTGQTAFNGYVLPTR